MLIRQHIDSQNETRLTPAGRELPGVGASILAAWALVKLCDQHGQFRPEDALHVCRAELIRRGCRAERMEA